MEANPDMDGAIAIDGTLSPADRLGALAMRLGIGRSRYRVAPGLYAIGGPGPKDPILVSANYKLSFDALRRAVASLRAWILVIDTRGINVWCAAGKGSFCAGEIARVAAGTGLASRVENRVLILPQLAAPGVAAHALAALTGFRAVYGPVRAADIPAFIAAGNSKTPEMSLVRFRLADRLILAPLEAIHYAPLAAALFALLAAAEALARRLFLPSAWNLDAWRESAIALPAAGLPAWGALFAGSILSPVLLPALPGRAFSAKGAIAGAATHLALWALMRWPPLQAAGAGLVCTAFSSFVALNFTGSSAFTSLSGVNKEVKAALPAQAAAAGLGLAALAVRAILGA